MPYAPDPVITLGDITFKLYEVPEWVTLGGAFRAIVHKQPGGSRQIDSLGPDDGPLRWNGMMLTADGHDRSLLLWEMYQAGDMIPFTFGGWAFDVIITNLELHHKAANRVEYKIEVTRVINAAEIAAPGAVAAPNDTANAANVVNA